MWALKKRLKISNITENAYHINIKNLFARKITN